MYKGHGLKDSVEPRYGGHELHDDEYNMEDTIDEATSMTRPFIKYDVKGDGRGFMFGSPSPGTESVRTPSDAENAMFFAGDLNVSRINELYTSTIGKYVPYKSIETAYVNNFYTFDYYRTRMCNYADKAYEGVSSFFSDLFDSISNTFVSILYVGRTILLNAIGMTCGVLLTLFILSLLSKLFIGNTSDFHEIPPTTKNKTDDNSRKTHRTNERPDTGTKTLTLEPVYFKDILGIDDAKEDLMEVVKFIKEPKLYENVGAKIPKGILLVGSPGTGKTMLAKAVATEAGIPFIYTSGPEFVEIFVGQGAQRVRNLFAKARKSAPCIIFIDEIDAVGTKRASGSFTGQNREHDQTLNQLLVELDGFNVSTGITVLAATNRLGSLDNALLRPGRFDRVIHIPLPTMEGREAILKKYLGNVKYEKSEVNIKDIARLTPGYSGADLKNLVNEAALNCVKNGRDRVMLIDIQEARDKVSMGSRRKWIQPEIQRRMTAYHEAGHALVAYHLYPDADPIHKATILSRGSALGFVEQLPEGDRTSYKLAQMKARLAVCMGGRIAEELVFGKNNVTSGASSDIYAATELAYKMVTEWGMSKKLGPVNYLRMGGVTNIHGNRTLSSETAKIVEQEVKTLVKEAHQLAEGILRQYRQQLEDLANELLERETLTGEEIETLLKAKKSQKTKK